MTRFDYRIYMNKRQHKIELKSKGKLVEIPPKVKVIRPANKWDLIGVC